MVDNNVLDVTTLLANIVISPNDAEFQKSLNLARTNPTALKALFSTCCVMGVEYTTDSDFESLLMKRTMLVTEAMLEVCPDDFIGFAMLYKSESDGKWNSPLLSSEDLEMYNDISEAIQYLHQYVNSKPEFEPSAIAMPSVTECLDIMDVLSDALRILMHENADEYGLLHFVLEMDDKSPLSACIAVAISILKISTPGWGERAKNRELFRVATSSYFWPVVANITSQDDVPTDLCELYIFVGFGLAMHSVL